GGTAALRSGAAALAVLGEGVGRKCEEWEARARAQVRRELNGGVRACEGAGRRRKERRRVRGVRWRASPSGLDGGQGAARGFGGVGGVGQQCDGGKAMMAGWRADGRRGSSSAASRARRRALVTCGMLVDGA